MSGKKGRNCGRGAPDDVHRGAMMDSNLLRILVHVAALPGRRPSTGLVLPHLHSRRDSLSGAAPAGCRGSDDGADPRNPPGALRDRVGRRLWRHGRRLSGTRYPARAGSGVEGDGAAHRLGSAHALALRDRSARGRVAEPSRYPLDLRAGGRRRRSVRGDGAARRPQPSRADFEGAAAVARGGRDRRRDCRRPGGRARQGNRPPRLEARERLPDQRRPRQDSRLRSRAAASRRRGVRSTDRRADGARGGARHVRIHVSRAGDRRERRWPYRRVRARLPALRDAHRRPAVHRHYAAGIIARLLHDSAPDFSSFDPLAPQELRGSSPAPCSAIPAGDSPRRRT